MYCSPLQPTNHPLAVNNYFTWDEFTVLLLLRFYTRTNNTQVIMMENHMQIIYNCHTLYEYKEKTNFNKSYLFFSYSFETTDNSLLC